MCKVLMKTNLNILVNILYLSCIIETGSEKYLEWLTSVSEHCIRTVLRSASSATDNTLHWNSYEKCKQLSC